MLRDALACRRPDTVILGLDILDLLQKPDVLPLAKQPADPDESRLLVDRDGHPNPDRPLQIWRDRIATTLTIDAVLDGLATPFDQDLEQSPTMTRHGFNPLHDYRVAAVRPIMLIILICCMISGFGRVLKLEARTSQGRRHSGRDALK